MIMDEVDRKIIALLKIDGRASITTLAAQSNDLQ